MRIAFAQKQMKPGVRYSEPRDSEYLTPGLHLFFYEATRTPILE